MTKQAFLVTLMLIFLPSQLLLSWQQPQSQSDLLGKALPLVVSTPATGAWNAKHPFDPTTFGKVRGHAPANQISQLAIFIDGIDATVWKLLKQIELLVAESNKEQCYVTLFDVRGAQVGGYQADELANRIAELQKLAKENQVERISLGIAANNSPGNKAKAGLDASHNFSIVLLTKPDLNERKAIVQSLILLDTKSSTTTELSAALKLIDQHLKAAETNGK